MRARDCWSRANQDKSVNEVASETVDAETRKAVVLTIESVISDVTLSHKGCEEREDGLVMIDSGASVNVFSKCFGKSKLEQSDGTIRLRGADGRPLQEHGKRQVDVTKPILSVSCLCENGVETHLTKQPFLRFGDGHEPLIRRGGVYFDKEQTVNAVEAVTQNKSVKSGVQRGDAQKWCVQPEDAQKRCVQPEDAQKRCVHTGDSQYRCVHPGDSEESMRTSWRCTTSMCDNQEIHIIDAYIQEIQRNRCVRPEDPQNRCVRAGDAQHRCVTTRRFT